MNYFEDSFLRALCSEVNKRLTFTDDRPTLTQEYIQGIAQKNLPPPGGEISPKVAIDILFNFFEHKGFVRKENPEDWKGNWLINTRFDEEWAINIFSKTIKLLATGVYKLDDILKGGFRVFSRKEEGVSGQTTEKPGSPVSVVLQGRPGSGKTTTALLMLCNFASQGYTSFYLSAEQRIESLLQIVQRFCKSMKREPGDSKSELYLCELRVTPSSDASKERERQFLRLKTPVEEVPHLFDEDSRSTEIAVRKFLKEREEETGNSSGRFFVAVLDGADLDHSDERFKKKVAELYKDEEKKERLHGIVITRVSLSEEDEIEYDSGAVFGASPKQFFDYYEAFKAYWPSLPAWLVLDSVTAFENAASRVMSTLFQQKEPHLSRLMLTEHVSKRDSSPNDLETSCDMLIELGERYLQVAPVADSPSNYMQRYLEIKKFRSSPFHRGKHPMAIKSGTVKVFRSIAILLKVTGNMRRDPLLSGPPLIFGIDGLDGPHGLNNSFSEGSFTVLQGPPGSYKTAMCSYFLTADHRRKSEGSSGGIAGRSLWYSFTADRRSVINGMRNFVDGQSDIFSDAMLQSGEDGAPPRIEIHDIKPGYLFPETFVEDLLDILSSSNKISGPPDNKNRITRIVFDSFDAIQAAYPIMRMDQFFWKVISQICSDYRVSALLKVSPTLFPRKDWTDTLGVLSGIADNVIEVNDDGKLKIVASEHRIHNNGLLQIEPTIIRQIEPSSIRESAGSRGGAAAKIPPPTPSKAPAKVWLRVKA